MTESDQLESGFRRRGPGRTARITFSLVVIAIGVFLYGRYRNTAANAELGRQFVARFSASFNSGLAELRSDPVIRVIDRFRVPESGSFTFRAPRQHEYVVTAKVAENGTVNWRRWLYTCNGDVGDAIYKFAMSSSAQEDALPVFPTPFQTYVPLTADLVDGVPTTAGASASNVLVSSPVRVTDPLIVSATAPPGTECRVEVFPADSLMSSPLPQQPAADGSVRWALQLHPKTAGAGLLLLVHCKEVRGARSLENAIRINAQVVP